MIDLNHPLPIRPQAKAVGISRGSVFYLPLPVSDENLELMWWRDRLHVEYPCAGSRMLRDLLRQDGD
jgi:putative transposase